MNQHKLYRIGQSRSRGFSTLELLLVMAVSLVVAALAIPGFNQVQRTLRISGDARDLNGAINQAKLLAAADFTRSRVYIDLGANTANTFHVDVWNKAAACWQVVGDVNNPCYLPGTSPVQSLSQGVTFGFAGVGAPPPNTQTGGIQQAPPASHPHGHAFGLVASSGCIEFNSRGVPIIFVGGAYVPAPNDAIYITDNAQVYAVTVGLTGMSQVWANNIQNNANWYQK